MRTTEKQAVGVKECRLMKIVCAFDVETWLQIRRLAVANDVSVAEMVRCLCEIGLEEINGP